MKREINILILATLILTALGALMMYSIGGVRTGANALILPKHLAFLVIGLLGFVTMINFDYHIFGIVWVRRAICLITLFLLFLTFVPGIGLEMGGAHRWIGWRQLSFQPSELARFTLVLILAVQLSKNQERINKFGISILVPGFFLGLYAGVVYFQKDMGIPFIMIVTTAVLLWHSGAYIKHLIIGGILGGTLLSQAVSLGGYRSARIGSFMNPWVSREGSGYQLIQSLSAFYQGGFWGRGIGYGEQKLGYLPAAHTDFIFAMIGEELGLIGTICVVFLFVIILIAGMRIVMKAPDLFGSLLASGITTLIVFQAFFVMLVNLGFLPTKGLPLPFVSYGGSALMTNLWMMGVLVNIGRQARVSETIVVAEGKTKLWARPLFWIFEPKTLKLS